MSNFFAFHGTGCLERVDQQGDQFILKLTATLPSSMLATFDCYVAADQIDETVKRACQRISDHKTIHLDYSATDLQDIHIQHGQTADDPDVMLYAKARLKHACIAHMV